MFKMMFSVPFFRYRFTSSWWIILLFVLALSFLLKLGFWQLERGREKRAILAAQQTMQTRRPTIWQTDMALPEQYQRVNVKGHFLKLVFFLDNQHFRHQLGYHVLSPLLLAPDFKKLVFVDRGWIKADKTRAILPDIKVSEAMQSLNGSVYYPSQNWLLGPSHEMRANKKIVVEQLDPVLFSKILQNEVYPFIIRLDADAGDGLIREWPLVSFSPKRHDAYALQWFAMACLLCLVFIAFNTRKENQ